MHLSRKQTVGQTFQVNCDRFTVSQTVLGYCEFFTRVYIGRNTCGCVCTDDPVPYEPLLANASADGVVGELKVPTPNPHLLVLELLAGRVGVTRLAEIRWVRSAAVLS